MKWPGNNTLVRLDSAGSCIQYLCSLKKLYSHSISPFSVLIIYIVTNMFIRPETPEELDNFEPDFTIINCCSQVDDDWKRHGLNSETAVVFNVEKKTAVIFGTWYGGENKKGIFSLMNYWLPMMGHFPMHCSANVGKKGDVALFFGLSGTGKTTLSADPGRALIGDDEHGWDNDGVFNFEGGCYAKTINLSEKTEPDIYRAIHTDALLENVKINEADHTPDYFDTTKTENGRVSYPIFHIPGYVSVSTTWTDCITSQVSWTHAIPPFSLHVVIH